MTNHDRSAAMTTVTVPAGPILGPDALDLTLTSVAAAPLALRVYPDAANTALRAAGEPTHYYAQFSALTLARRADGHCDFSMTAITRRDAKTPTSSASIIEYIGGTGTFTTTTALPDTAREEITQHLTQNKVALPPSIRELFTHRPGDPAPTLTTVPVIRSTIDVHLAPTTPGRSTEPVSLQHTTTGSIETQAHNTYQLTCGPLTTERIVTSLRDGTSLPILVTDTVTEQFHTGATPLSINLLIDLDRVHDALLSRSPSGEALTACDISAALKNSAAVGAIRIDNTATTTIKADLAHWIINSDPAKAALITASRDVLFDPAPLPATTTDTPIWLGPLRDVSVTAKRDYRSVGSLLRHPLTLAGPVTFTRTLDADFAELARIDKSEIGRYLTIIDVAGF
ncbi:hypothetical protein [Nocardia fluminea]|uniref:hypothetical protein n=1 Tax=Nocardia fluminea TaxID=134984 RepID=UPI003664B6AD